MPPARKAAAASSIETPTGWDDYTLLDSGDRRRLERFGPHRLVRPDDQALWRPHLPPAAWAAADATLERAPNRKGAWSLRPGMPRAWDLHHRDLSFTVKLTPFGHVGVFPEQAAQWTWVRQQLGRQPGARVLNLFAYTGLSTLSAAVAGAAVTHVDASRAAVAWAAENQRASRLNGTPVRWIVDDALGFTRREARRGHRYDALILDPPKFGRGPGGEVWKFEDSLPDLLEACGAVLEPNPLFVVLTAYAVPFSPLTLGNLVAGLLEVDPAAVECGELALQEEASPRLLPVALFARWVRGGDR